MWTEDVAKGLEESGAEILIVPNGSPFEYDKQDVRMNLAVARMTETGLPLIYCNQVGGQDELVLDGTSFVLNADRRLAAQAKSFEEDLLITRWRRGDDDVWACVEGRVTPPIEGHEAVYRAMCLGLRDYVDKNGFPGVVLGLSGGIDSALSAAVAADALGPDDRGIVFEPQRARIHHDGHVGEAVRTRPFVVPRPHRHLVDRAPVRDHRRAVPRDPPLVELSRNASAIATILDARAYLTFEALRDPADECARQAQFLTGDSLDRVAVDVLPPQHVRHPAQPAAPR